MNIPFVDLKAQYQSLKPEMDDAIKNVIDNTAFIKGPFVKEFESSYSQAYDVKHTLSCGNGTDAIYIALKTLGIGPGDEVITTALSWISTSETITQTGAKVVFVDIDPDYYTIDPQKIEEKITNKTKAIIPVHIYGQSAPMDKIMSIAKQYNLKVIEDCAQAHFAEWKGERVGQIGDIGTFSFFPGKNLGAYGDAGGIITNNDEYAEKIRMYSNHGALQKHHHNIEGINSRLDGLQAAVLSVKLPHILKWNELRRNHAQTYTTLLNNQPVKIPKINNDGKHVFHLYVIQHDDRDGLQAHLKEQGIATGIHYPTALPFLNAYNYLGHTKDDFPHAYNAQSRILSLPMYPELRMDQIEYVVENIKSYQ